MRFTTRTTWLAAILAGLTLLSSGCIELVGRSSIEADGTGTLSISQGLAKSFLEEADRSFEEAEQNFRDGLADRIAQYPEEWNARAEVYNNETHIGTIVTIDVDLDNLEERFNEMVASSMEDSEDAEQAPEILRDKPMMSLTRVRNEDGVVTIQGATGLDMGDMSDEEQQEARLLMMMLTNSMELRLHFTLPSITDTDNMSVNGTTATHRVRLTERRDFTLTGRLDGEGGDGNSADGDGADAEPFELTAESLIGTWAVDGDRLRDIPAFQDAPDETIRMLSQMRFVFTRGEFALHMQAGRDAQQTDSYTVRELNAETNTITIELKSGNVIDMTFDSADQGMLALGDPPFPVVRVDE